MQEEFEGIDEKEKRDRIQKVGKLQYDIEDAEHFGKMMGMSYQSYCKSHPEECEKQISKDACDINFPKKVLNKVCKCGVEKRFDSVGAYNTKDCLDSQDLVQKAKEKEARKSYERIIGKKKVK